MRIVIAATVCLLCLEIGQAAEPMPAKGEPARTETTVSREAHLQLAVEHPRAVGLNDEADRIARRIEGTNQTPLQRLAELRAAIDRALEEVEQLEVETGFTRQNELWIKCFEVATVDVRKIGLDASERGERRSLVLDASRMAAVNGILDELQRGGRARMLAETRLASTNGRPASMVCGDSLPMAMPANDGKATIQWLEIRNRVETVARLLESRRIRIDMDLEHTERDGDHGAKVRGSAIPASRQCKLSTQFEAGIGETAVWIIEVPIPNGEAPEPSRQAVSDALVAAGLGPGVKIATRLEPRTTIVFVRPERSPLATDAPPGTAR